MWATVPLLPELVQVERERVARAGASSTRTITFSWRRQESSVQFVEPDQTSVAVADDVLVVHQVGNAGDGARRDGQGRDRLGNRARRRRYRDRPRVVDVVDEPNRDTPLVRGQKRRQNERACVGLEADVVYGDVEARACGPEEGGELAGDLRGV